MKGLLFVGYCLVAGLSFGAYSTTCPQHGTLKQVLDRYAELTGKKVELVQGLPGIGSAIDPDDESLTAASIEAGLKSVNIGIFPIGDDRVVVSLLKTDTLSAREYLEKYKKTHTVVPIFGWAESRRYIEEVPVLKELRAEFDAANDVLGDLLAQDEEYSAAQEAYKNSEGDDRKAALSKLKQTKYSVFKRLQKESPEYQEARKNREEALYQSNIATFEYMINDYEKKGKTIPLDWIKPKHIHSH